MDLEKILEFLKPFSAILKPELLALEDKGIAELNKIVAQVESPDLKLLLEVLVVAIDKFADAEIEKI